MKLPCLPLSILQNRLTAHESVAAHTLHDLLPATAPAKGSKAAATGADGDQLPVLLLIDTAGCGYEERQEEEGDSRSNEGEAQAVAAHVQKLVAAGIRPEAIGVITPYSAQVRNTMQSWTAMATASTAMDEACNKISSDNH